MKPTIIDYDPQELIPTQPPEPDPTLTIKDYLRDAEQKMASTGVYSGPLTLGGSVGGATTFRPHPTPPSDLAVLNTSISELTSHIAGLNSLISLLIKDLNRKP